jgi:hypothetical protein
MNRDRIGGLNLPGLVYPETIKGPAYFLPGQGTRQTNLKRNRKEVFRLAQTCSVCKSKHKMKIDTALINGESYRSIAKRFSFSESSVYRHYKNHLPKSLIEAKESEETIHCETIKEDYDRNRAFIIKLLRACDEWLTDPANPDKYSLTPRDYEIEVIYLEYSDGNETPVKKKDKLSTLLSKVQGDGLIPISWETKSADPRELILKTVCRSNEMMKLIADLREKDRLEKELEELREIIEGMRDKANGKHKTGT